MASNSLSKHSLKMPSRGLSVKAQDVARQIISYDFSMQAYDFKRDQHAIWLQAGR